MLCHCSGCNYNVVVVAARRQCVLAARQRCPENGKWLEVECECCCQTLINAIYGKMYIHYNFGVIRKLCGRVWCAIGIVWIVFNWEANKLSIVHTHKKHRLRNGHHLLQTLRLACCSPMVTLHSFLAQVVSTSCSFWAGLEMTAELSSISAIMMMPVAYIWSRPKPESGGNVQF